MSQKIAILGSTGSIGRQSLEVCAGLNLPVTALAAGYNIELLEQQVRRFHPRLVSVARQEDAGLLQDKLQDLAKPPEILWGSDGNNAVATAAEASDIIAAMVGVAGLEPVMAAIIAGKKIALANKETLVAGGALVMPLLAEYGSIMRPVDSEHSAIWQCLAGAPSHSLSRIFLTASGGPFRGYNQEQLRSVRLEQALRHPTWNMGGKITVDSATLMNKGLEVIEASWLFDCPVEQIEVVVHPQSIIHSMVEFTDGSILAQLGFPDMKLPIQLALTWPERLPGRQEKFNPFDSRARELTFERPDRVNFPLLDLAYAAARKGGTLPAVMNAANESAVNKFLAGKIEFVQIASVVEQCMNRHMQTGFMTEYNLDDMMGVDRWARDMVKEIC